jgi:hypothetical protein
MKSLLEKLQTIEKKATQERGKFDLFALFLREESADRWDLLVSSDWISANKASSLKYLAEEVQKAFSPEEITRISGIVIIEKSNPALSALLSDIHLEHGVAEKRDVVYFGLQIKHAYFITSRQRKAA